MKKSESVFLTQLEKLGKEQAQIEKNSPLPEWLRPLAAGIGEQPWQMLAIGSFVAAAFVSTWFYPTILALSSKGVLQWLFR